MTLIKLMNTEPVINLTLPWIPDKLFFHIFRNQWDVLYISTCQCLLHRKVQVRNRVNTWSSCFVSHRLWLQDIEHSIKLVLLVVQGENVFITVIKNVVISVLESIFYSLVRWDVRWDSQQSRGTSLVPLCGRFFYYYYLFFNSFSSA